MFNYLKLAYLLQTNMTQDQIQELER